MEILTGAFPTQSINPEYCYLRFASDPNVTYIGEVISTRGSFNISPLAEIEPQRINHFMSLTENLLPMFPSPKMERKFDGLELGLAIAFPNWGLHKATRNLALPSSVIVQYAHQFGQIHVITILLRRISEKVPPKLKYVKSSLK